MKEVLRIIIIIAIAYLILRTSTYGWRYFFRPFASSVKAPHQNLRVEQNIDLADILKSHVYKLSSEIGERSVFRHDKLEEAAEYIIQNFKSFGYNLEFQSYTVEDKLVKNIIAAKPGVRRPKEIVIVGAHYDTCFNPGADDNASAVAGLLELARFISDKKTNRTIKFIAFVNEEPPFFKTEQMGSRVYAKAAKGAREDIKAVLALECIGYYSDKPNSQQYPPLFGLFYPNQANFIAIVGNFHSHRLVKKVVAGFKEETDFPIESVVTFGFVPGVDFSDHSSFWKEGYPAVMVTDTAFYRYPHYHSYSDTYEKLDYESSAEAVKGLSAVLMTLTK